MLSNQVPIPKARMKTLAVVAAGAIVVLFLTYLVVGTAQSGKIVAKGIPQISRELIARNSRDLASGSVAVFRGSDVVSLRSFQQLRAASDIGGGILIYRGEWLYRLPDSVRLAIKSGDVIVDGLDGRPARIYLNSEMLPIAAQGAVLQIGSDSLAIRLRVRR